MKYLLILLLFTGCSILEGAASKYRASVEADGKMKAGIAGAVKYIGVDAEGTAHVAVQEKDGTVVFEKDIAPGTKKAWKRSGKKFNEIDWSIFILEWELPW